MTAAALSLVLPAKGGPKMVQGHSESRLPFILATVSANCLPTYLFTYLPTYLPLLAVPFTQAAFDACG